jgi:hypothetical protein
MDPNTSNISRVGGAGISPNTDHAGMVNVGHDRTPRPQKRS